MATQLAEVDNHSIQYVSAKSDGIGGRGLYPLLFQICELGGLASHCVKLDTQTCMQYHSYRYTIILITNQRNCKLRLHDLYSDQVVTFISCNGL